MSKTRGNKTSKAARAERQEKAVELMKTGETQEAIADQLGISRTTFWRDLRAIEKKYVAGSTEAIIELKSKTLNAVAEQMDAVLAGTLPEGRANAWKGLVAEFSKIAFPRESHHLRMNLNVNPLAQGMYGVFNQHCARFRTQASWDAIWAFIDALPDDWSMEQDIRRRGLRTLAEIQADEQKLLEGR